MSISKKKKHWEMTSAELREATREYDKELPAGRDGLPGRPMNAREHKQWNALRKKMGRPRVGRGIKRVMISLEVDLLRQSDTFARRHHLNRSQLISAGLRKMIAA